MAAASVPRVSRRSINSAAALGGTVCCDMRVFVREQRLPKNTSESTKSSAPESTSNMALYLIYDACTSKIDELGLTCGAVEGLSSWAWAVELGRPAALACDSA